MSVLDVVLGGLLLYALYKGCTNGLFVELASLLSLFVGVYLSLKFSSVVAEALSKMVGWSSKTIEVTAFAFTFIAVVIGIHLLAKVFTGIMNFAFLGWMNTLGGGLLSVLKTVLALGIVFSIFAKINGNHWMVKEETLNNSLFYNPIQKTAQFMYPKLEQWYQDIKAKKLVKPSEETAKNPS